MEKLEELKQKLNEKVWKEYNDRICRNAKI